MAKVKFSVHAYENQVHFELDGYKYGMEPAYALAIANRLERAANAAMDYDDEFTEPPSCDICGKADGKQRLKLGKLDGEVTIICACEGCLGDPRIAEATKEEADEYAARFKAPQP